MSGKHWTDSEECPKANELASEEAVRLADGCCTNLIWNLRKAKDKCLTLFDETEMAIEAYHKVAENYQKVEIAKAKRELAKSGVGKYLEQAEALEKKMDDCVKVAANQLKEMGEICKRGAEYESEIQDRLSGKVQKEANQLQPAVQKDWEASQETIGWQNDANKEVLGPTSELLDQLSKVKDKAIAKRCVELDKKLRHVTDVLGQVESKAGDASEITSNGLELIKCSPLAGALRGAAGTVPGRVLRIHFHEFRSGARLLQ